MKTSVDWKIDSDGMVLGPGFHDGKFYGIVHDENDNLLILTKNHQGDRRRIELINVTVMRVTNFLRGNIISNVWFWRTNEISIDKWEKLFEDQLASHNYNEDLKKIIARNRNSHFFTLDSSYGAEIYATCDKMEIFQD